MHALGERHGAFVVLAGELRIIALEERADEREVVADHAELRAVLHLHDDLVDAGILDGLGLLARNLSAALGQHLAGIGMHDVLHRFLAGDALGKRQLFVVLIAADVGQIVALRIEEQRIHQARRRLNRRRFARAQLVVDLDQRLIPAAVIAQLAAVVDRRRVARQRRGHALVGAEQPGDLLVGLDAHRAQQHRHRQLARAVDARKDHAVGIGLVLDPRAAVGDHLRGVQRHARLVDRPGVIHARRANQLRDDDALGAVDDKRAVLGHEREIAHEHLGLLDLVGIAVRQPHGHLQRRRVGGVALLALVDGVLRLVVQRIIRELKDQTFTVVGYGGNVRQHLAEPFLQKAPVRILLHLNQIGYCQRLFNAGKTHSRALTHLHRMNHTFNHPCLPKSNRRSVLERPSLAELRR